MSDQAIRTSRTLGINPNLSENDRYLLTQLTYAPGFKVLLDIFEQACIEQETRLLNVSVSEPANVVAEHMMAKAFWQCFIYVQKRIAREGAFAEEGLAEPDPSEVIL